MTQSTEIVPRGAEVLTYEQVEDILINGAALDIIPPEALQGDIARRILAAETVEDAFAEFVTTKAREIEGLKVTVHGVAFAPSAYEEGPAVFAFLDVTRDKSDAHEIVSMGGRSLMASFLWAQRHDGMPLVGTFIQRASKTSPERKFWTFNLA